LTATDATTTNNGLILQSSSVTKSALNVAATTNQGINGTAAGDQYNWTTGGKMLWSTNNGTNAHLILDSSGNVGIGTTPQSHYTGYTALDLGTSGSIWSNRTTADTNTIMMANNAYLNSGATSWLRIHADEATLYEQGNGRHIWSYAASGSAGSAISWSEAMRLDTGGNLLVGTTSFGYTDTGAELRATGQAALTVDGNACAYMNRLTSDGRILEFSKDSTTVGSIGTNGTRFYLVGSGRGLAVDESAYSVLPVNTTGANNDGGVGLGSASARFSNLYLSGTLTNNGTGGINIDTSGNVGIGTSSPVSRLEIEDAGTASSVLLKVTADDQSPYGIIVGNDTYSTSDTDGLTFDVNNSGVSSIRARGTGSVLKFDTNGEAMRIDNSGNVLVGTTDTTPWNNSANSTADNGFVVSSNGTTGIARYQAEALNLNRTGNDGSILDFQRSGTTVGTIGTNSSALTFGTGDTGVVFFDTIDSIAPLNTSTNSGRDAAINIGASFLRFKDLYLSGSISDGTNSKTVADIVSGGGKVLQVVSNYDQSTYNLSSSGYFGPSVTITPSSTSSKLLILVMYSVGNSNNNGGVKILQNGSNFLPDLPNAYNGGSSSYGGAIVTSDDSWGSSTAYSIIPVHVQYLHSPNSTSALTYRGYWYNAGSGNLRLNRQEIDNGGRAFSYMTIMEIAG